MALGGISITRGLSLTLVITTSKASTSKASTGKANTGNTSTIAGSNNLSRARHHRADLNADVRADLRGKCNHWILLLCFLLSIPS